MKYIILSSLFLLGLFISPAWALLILITFLVLILLARDQDPTDKNFLMSLFLIGLSLRLIFVFIVQFYLVNKGFCPGAIDSFADAFEGSIFFDEHNFIKASREISFGLSNYGDYYFRNAHLVIISWFFSNFGYDPLFGKLLNCLWGVFSALLVYRCTRIIFVDYAIAKFAAIFTMFYPSLLFWSVTNLRDQVIIFLVVLFFYVLLKFYNRNFFYGFSLALIVAFIINIFRSGYFFIFAIFLVGVSLVRFIKKRRIILRSLLVGVIFILFFTLSSKNVISFGNRFLLRAADKQISNATATESEGNFLLFPLEFQHPSKHKFVPLRIVKNAYLNGLFYAVFAPFPWGSDIKTFMGSMIIVEALIWYFCLVFIIIGIIIGIYKNKLCLLAFSFLFINVSFLALFEGNVGTLFRHRAVIMPIYFIFLGNGFVFVFRRFLHVWNLRNN
ncbi:MAG: hypothetical protein PHO70_00460 [Candidatus Omnitrophica bacterium]|nr:hypothetical protein [Candidatus Omnitrophota bacterium]